MLENLQILRAFAALAVVVYHVLFTAGDYGLSVRALRWLQGWGKDGVDVFFVISGFVMVYAQSQRPKGRGEFLWHRIVRIVPLYWLLTAALGILVFAMPALSRTGPPSPGRLAASFAFLSCVLYRNLPLVFVGWSLEYEMFFYVLFAVAIGFSRRAWTYGFVGGVLLLLVAFSAVRPVALEFLIGMLCAEVFRREWVRRYAWAAAGSGLLLLLVSVPWPGLPACLLVLGAAAMPQVRSPFWSFLGAASYSIYLGQVFAIPAFYKVAARYLGAVPVDVLAICAVLATTAAGCALYVGVERPMTRALQRLQRAPFTQAAAARA